MNTFQRYLIHFTLIVSVIVTFLAIFVLADKNINATPLSVILVITAALIYIVPMALIFSHKAQIIQLEVLCDMDEKKISELEEIIQKKSKRNIRNVSGHVHMYTMENKYQSWLTNPIEIIQEKNMFIVKIPRAYKEEIQKVFLCKVI